MSDAVTKTKEEPRKFLGAGAYLRYLRDAQQMSRMDIARKAELTEGQLYQIEKKGRASRTELLGIVLRAVGGSAEDLLDLMTPSATAEDGERLAQEWLDKKNQQDINKVMSLVTPENRERILEMIEKIANDPRKLERLLGYGEALSDQ